MTADLPSVAAGTAPLFAVANSEPLPVGEVNGAGFAALMAEVLDTSGAVVPAECDAKPSASEPPPTHPSEPGDDDEVSADALTMAGFTQALAIMPALPPAARTEVGKAEADKSVRNANDLPAIAEAPQKAPITRGLTASDPLAITSAVEKETPLTEVKSVSVTAATTNDLSPTTLYPPAMEPPAASDFQVGMTGEPKKPAPIPEPSVPFNPKLGLAADPVPVERVVAMQAEHAMAEVRPEIGKQPPSVRLVSSAAEAKFAVAEKEHDLAMEPLEPPVPPAGTTTAEQGDGMRNTTPPKQIAGPGQQNLPESGMALRSVSSELPRRGGGHSVREADLTEIRQAVASPFILLGALGQPELRGAEGPGTLVATAANSPTPIEPLEAAVLRHVTELRHAGATELAVVLKPDAETQLALRLTRNGDGEVLVQARCEQGDAQLLTANWGEIRHALAQQGVRLGALEFAGEQHHPDTFQPHAGTGGPSPDGQPSSQRHGQPWPETLDDLPLVGSITEPPARRGVQRPPAGHTRLLESWA